jgi:hypothetical protein
MKKMTIPEQAVIVNMQKIQQNALKLFIILYYIIYYKDALNRPIWITDKG